MLLKKKTVSLEWDIIGCVSVVLCDQTHQNLRDRSLTPQSPTDSLLSAQSSRLSNTDSH